VLSLGLAGPLLSPGIAALPTLAVTAVDGLCLVVLSQLPRVDLVLLKLAARLRARWLWWGHLFG